MSEASGERRELSERLERFLESHFDTPVRVENLHPMAGGASREIYGFDLLVPGRDRPLELILRMDPEAGRMESDRGAEFAVLRAAERQGVTAPHVHCLGGREHGLPARFLVMDRIAGQAIARPLLRDEQYASARAALPRQLARELTRIHAIDVGESGLPVPDPSPDRPMAFSVSEVARYLTSLTMAAGDDPYPVLALVGRWLEQHAPNASRRAVVHGDFRIGNILYDASGLTAVLDWELAHVGDPLEDVGWLCVRAWRFGNDEMPVGGLCSREQFWELYEGESGVVVDPAAALYWELFGNWKWAIICVIQAASFRKGRYPNLELASLGRRVGEVEWELLSLLEAAERGLVTGTNRKGGQGDVA